MKNNGFQNLENKQSRTVIAQKEENEEDKSSKCISSCQLRVSSTQVKEGKT